MRQLLDIMDIDAIKVGLTIASLLGILTIVNIIDPPPSITLPSGRRVKLPRTVTIQKRDEYRERLIDMISKGEMARNFAKSVLPPDASEEDIDFVARWYASRLVDRILS